MNNKILIVHNQLSKNPTRDEYDVITQIEAIGASLKRLGHTVDTLGLTLDLEAGRDEITRRAPDLIFNCVESLNGDDRFAPAAALLFESLRIPYTGSSSAALAVTSHKLVAKKICAAAGVPTPLWSGVEGNRLPLEYPFIMKSATDHASIGITDTSVIRDEAAWDTWCTEHASSRPLALFAEQYIHGREFNLSVIHVPGGGVRVLPVAEIVFDNFPEGKPHIVGYAAKWEESTFEYRHTRRTFPAAPADAELYEACKALARTCFHLFSLSGYARVDMRISPAGNPAILEVNANPCLSPDAGFCAACIEAGIGFDAMIEALVAAAAG